MFGLNIKTWQIAIGYCQRHLGYNREQSNELRAQLKQMNQILRQSQLDTKGKLLGPAYESGWRTNAILYRNIGRAIECIADGANPNMHDENGLTLGHYIAVLNSDSSCHQMESYLKAGGSPNARGHWMQKTREGKLVRVTVTPLSMAEELHKRGMQALLRQYCREQKQQDLNP